MVTLPVASPAVSRIPRQLVAGLMLVAIFWPIAWFGHDVVPHTFFPLWLGYVLSVDGLVFMRTGTSALSRSRTGFFGLFVLSIPLWWAFEIFNIGLQNWSYELPHAYGWWRYHIEASVAFSTVIPALVVTAEFWGSTRIVEGLPLGPRFGPGPGWRTIIAIAGVVMMLAALVKPTVFFPLIWIGAFLALDPVNRALRAESLNAEVAGGRWNRFIAWGLAGLTCGWFWEMWNWQSLPKWTYAIPWADWLHVFEMPLLGYGGYIPFALEVFAVSALAARFIAPIRRVFPAH